MSLLGTNVYANPNTPIWGQGGGGGGTVVIPYGSNVQFTKTNPSGAYVNLGLQTDAFNEQTLTVVNPNNFADTLMCGDLQLLGDGGNPSQPVLTFATLDGTGNSLAITCANGQIPISISNAQLDLSNVSSINGVPYFNAPGTYFDFSNQGGTPVAESPNSTILNSFSFVAPVNGKLYMESLGNFVSTVKGGGGNMGFSIGGSVLSNAINQFNAYDSNVNLFGMSMYQIPVTGGLTYDISSIAQCSALPPAGSDLLVQTSRLFLLFTPN